MCCCLSGCCCSVNSRVQPVPPPHLVVQIVGRVQRQHHVALEYQLEAREQRQLGVGDAVCLVGGGGMDGGVLG